MLVISDRNKLFKLWWSREFLVINHWYFFLQPIRIPNINDQENIDANESDTDPQPTCLAPQKVLPGNTCGDTYVFFQSVCCVSVMFKQIISPKSLVQSLGLKLCPKISRNVYFMKVKFQQHKTLQMATTGQNVPSIVPRACEYTHESSLSWCHKLLLKGIFNIAKQLAKSSQVRPTVCFAQLAQLWRKDKILRCIQS